MNLADLRGELLERAPVRGRVLDPGLVDMDVDHLMRQCFQQCRQVPDEPA